MVYVASAILLSSACSCLLLSAEFRATCGRYIKEVFSSSPLPLSLRADRFPSCLPLSAEFRATCGRYIKEVFSMPGSITDQEVSPAAAREQVRGLFRTKESHSFLPGSITDQEVSPAAARKQVRHSAPSQLLV